MKYKSFSTFFYPYFWLNRVLILFIWVSLSIPLKAQDLFFVPASNQLRNTDPFLDSLTNKVFLSASTLNIRKIQSNAPEKWLLWRVLKQLQEKK